MGEGYGTLRLWATVLVVVVVLGVIFDVIGTIFAVFAATAAPTSTAFAVSGHGATYIYDRAPQL